MENFTNAETAFNKDLSELYGAVDIMGYQFSTGPALRKLDPIAYREAFLDWLDSEQSWVEECYPGLNHIDVEDYYTEDGDFDQDAYLEVVSANG